MWWKRVAAIASAGLLAAAGCRTVPPPKSTVRAPQLSKRLTASDLLPADLDVVLRVDMARLRAGLGPAFAEALAARAGEAGGEAFVSEAMDGYFFSSDRGSRCPRTSTLTSPSALGSPCLASGPSRRSLVVASTSEGDTNA